MPLEATARVVFADEERVFREKQNASHGIFFRTIPDETPL